MTVYIVIVNDMSHVWGFTRCTFPYVKWGQAHPSPCNLTHNILGVARVLATLYIYIQSYAKVCAPLIISITFIYKLLGVWIRNFFVIYIILHGHSDILAVK